MSDQDKPAPANWERSVLEKLALSAIQEQRRSRHWSILFKTLGFLYLFIVLFLAAGWFGSDGVSIKEHTALVDLQGVIASDQASADSVIGSLQGAFEDKKTKGVILRINSPGGSPVQAGQIYDEIRRLRALHPKIPLYAVVDDICASGGYYVAVGADKIFVDKASIVGSIGVLMDGFGFTQTMQKLGVERRLLTAGENKGFLDPFSPVDPKQAAFAKQMLEEIHGQFIGVVREGRGKRLQETPEMFSGLVWSGEKSIQLGLADALGNVESVARDVIKAEDIVDYTQREGLAARLASRLGASVGKALMPFEQAGVRLR
ncbi:S49 family peptidase [Thiobacillus sp. 65-1402]|uniref:S49 family peptidase n=1 Tax=Thiobacillus sp. 65-1402 TaxID=1895861 RepID=UPI0009651D6F|nr:S49 family peptidase [Thiobacillus sp. 65-1402]OJW74892.1 MAG: S49 family peptidase [Thiobacillus sp. 65-1402]